MDPREIELLAALYGDGAFEVITKAEKSREERTKQNIALATNAAGAVAGPAALWQATKAAKAGKGGVPRDIGRAVVGEGKHKKIGRLRRKAANAIHSLDTPTSKKTAIAAGVASSSIVGLQAANWAGDVISAQHFSAQRKKDKVEKASPDSSEVHTPAPLKYKLIAVSADTAKPVVVEAGKKAGSKTKKLVKDKVAKGFIRDLKDTAANLKQASEELPNTAKDARKAAKNIRRGSGVVPVVTGAAVGAGAMAAGYQAGKKVPKKKDVIGKADDLDITWEGEIAKMDTDRRQVFGWASVVEVNGEPVVDLQGDFITVDEIEKAAYSYVQKSRKGGDMHQREGDGPKHVSDMIESFVVTPEKIEKMGLPASTPVGWWVGFQVNDDETWNLVKSGKRTGFSVHGRGKREPL